MPDLHYNDRRLSIVDRIHETEVALTNAVLIGARELPIESDALIVADRTISWDANGYGAHSEHALESPALTWYLAEGATHSGFDLFYLVQNCRRGKGLSKGEGAEQSPRRSVTLTAKRP